MTPVLIRFVLPVCTLLFVLFAALPSCTHESDIIEGMDTVFFSTEILPILQTSCGKPGCHDGSAEGFSPRDYDAVMNSVVAGDPRGSKLYDVITRLYGESMMPPDQPLTKDQRTLIHIWIAQGANNY